MSRTEWVRDTLIAGGLSVEHADRVMAEVKAEQAAELDRLRNELEQTVKQRDYWHAELMHADARILELQRQIPKGDDVDCARCVPPELASAEAVLREQVARHTAAKDWDEDELVAFHEAIQLVTHPDAPVSTDETYPEWAAALAARTHTGGQA